MTRARCREKALILRKHGCSYSQIKRTLKVSKSTLSYWLHDYPLSKKRIRELRDWNERRIEKYRVTMRKKRETRLVQFYNEERGKIFPLTQRELFIAGLFLYWGEGSKRLDARLVVSNTDSAVIKFFIVWAIRSLGIPLNKFRVSLHLYNDMNLDQEVKYWSRILAVPLKQFGKPYIKKTSKYRINHKGTFGHGTCNVSICGARMSERVLMAIKSISDTYRVRGSAVRAFGL